MSLIKATLRFAFLTFVILSTAAGQPASDPALKKDFPILSRNSVGEAHADYIVVIDKSGSMNHVWKQVQSALTSFIQGIPDGDRLAVLVFGNEAGGLEGAFPTEINSQTRQMFLTNINSLVPTDQKTDLGAAFEKSLDQMARLEGNNLEFVFFLTDFNHDAPQTSIYKDVIDKNHERWQSLKRKRENELRDKAFEAFGIQLHLGGVAGQHYYLGQEVFGNIDKVEIENPQLLIPWFEERKKNILRDKLKLSVKEDLKRAPLAVEKIDVNAPFVGPGGELVVSARPNGYRIVNVSGLSSIKGNVAFVGEQPSRIHIEPTAEQEISMNSSDEARRIVLGEVKCDSCPIIRSYVPHKIQVVMEGVRETPPDEKAEILKLNPDPRIDPKDLLKFQTQPVAFDVMIPEGIIPLWLLLLCAGIAVAVVGGGLYWRRPEYLQGRLEVLGIATREIDRSEKKREVVIGNVKKGEGIVVPGAQWRLYIATFKPGGEQGRARGTYARAERGSATMKTGDTIMGDWRPLPRGARLTIGGKTIRWD